MSPLQENSSEMDVICDHNDKEPASFHLPLSPRKSSRRPTSEKPRGRDDLWIGAVPPPFPLLSATEPHCPLLLSSQKPKGNQTRCPRRKIFSGILTNNNPSTHFSTPTQSPRKVFDFHRFTPSPKFLHDALHETGERYRPIAKLPSSYAYLPAVPTPLKRLYLEDGSAACLSGTYPLQRLPSILRQSSYRKPAAVQGEKHDNTIETKTSSNSFNLAKSIRIHEETSKACERYNEDTASSSPSSWEANHVLFDPRITVIEFKSDFQRQWISEAELDKFKRETISLAENYLQQHPELMEKYSIPIKDSVTCTLRRRALFSLPVMSQCECDDQADTVERNGRQNEKGSTKGCEA